MKRTLSIILLIALLVTLPAALFACGRSAVDGIKGIYMTSAGVLLISDEDLAVSVFDRHGENIFSKLTKLKKGEHPEFDVYMTGKKAFLLDFAALAEASNEGSYKCHYSIKGESAYLEHTYIISATAAEPLDIYSAEAVAEGESARLTVKVEPRFANLFYVWTDSVKENSRFADTALECVSSSEQLAAGEMIYDIPVAVGQEKSFYTRGLYNIYGYDNDELKNVLNSDDPDFTSSCVCIELLNPADSRVFNLGTETHMQKFTVYSPSESVKLTSVYSPPPVVEEEPPEFTAELIAEGGKAKLKVTPYPNAVYYRAVITETCNGKSRVVCNATLENGKTIASANIRTDAEASYTGDVYATLSDGSMTEKLILKGFKTSYVNVPTPEVTYENGEVRAVFPRGTKVSVWRSGSPVNTDTLVIASGGVYSYTPTGPGEYGFIYKVFGNNANLLDSGLINSPTVKVE